MTEIDQDTLLANIHGRYELQMPPLEGGFAYVYRARDLRMERTVALKCLKPERVQDNRWLDTFRAEAINLASIDPHPNVVQIYDVDTDPDSEIDYFTMEWVEGRNLGEWRYSQPILDVAQAIELAISICHGLQVIHQSGLIHGDITTRNILLTKQSNQLIPKLTDFGLSWHVDDGVPSIVAGTRLYLAPEQLNGGSWDHRADIYSVGAVLFFLFTGEHYLSSVQSSLDEEITLEKLKSSILKEQPRSLYSVLGTTNNKLSELLLRLLEKSPDDRPQSISEVLLYLEDIRSEYQQRSYQNGYMPSATRSEMVIQEEAILQETIALYITRHAGESFRERIRPKFEAYNGKSSWRWDSDEELIEEVFGLDTEYDIYIYNDGPGRDTGQHNLRLFVATDSSNESNLQLLEVLNATLVLNCVHRPSNSSLLVRSVTKLSAQAGIRNANSLPVAITLVEEHRTRGNEHDISPEILNRVKKLPQGIQADPEVQKRLEHWKTYLAVWERIVQEKTYDVEYQSWRPERRKANDTVRIWFNLGEDAAWLWEKIRSSKNDRIHLFERKEQPDSVDDWQWDDDETEPAYVELGFIRQVKDSREGFSVQVELDDDAITQYQDEDGALDIPIRGFLAYRAIGDLAQIRKQKRAFDDLEKGKSANPRLGQFIFDVEQAVYPDQDRIILRPDEFLLKSLNDNQRNAVEGALTAPDLFLIWGPPGTGKTTVIAELCYQFAKQGQRVLVASQANLAVDNALSKLVHHPSIVALRIGNTGRIEQEGKPFTEAQVVSTWFESTRDNVQKRLSFLDERFDRFAAFVEADFLHLDHYLKTMRKYEQEFPALQSECDDARNHLIDLQDELASDEERRDNFYAVYQLLEDTATYLREDRLPDYEAMRGWRSPAVDLVSVPIYQEYLQSLAYGFQFVERTSPSDFETIEQLITRDERLVLQNLNDGVEGAGLYRHRVTTMLLLGKTIKGIFLAEFQTFATQLAGLEDYVEQVRVYHQICSHLETAEELLAARQTAQVLYDLNPLMRTLLKDYDNFEIHQEQLNNLSIQLQTVNEQIESLKNRFEALNQQRTARYEVDTIRQTISERCKALTDEVPHLNQARNRVQMLVEQTQGRSLITRQIEMTLAEQEQVVSDCQQILTQIERLSEPLNTWLVTVHQSDTSADPAILVNVLVDSGLHYVPDVIVQSLVNHRSQLIKVDKSQLIQQFEKVLEIAHQAIREYEVDVPPNHPVDEKLADGLRRQLIAQFNKQQVGSETAWIPKDTSQFTDAIRSILEDHTAELSNVKSSWRLGRRDWTKQASELVSLRKFAGFVHRQLKLQKKQTVANGVSVNLEAVRVLLDQVMVEQQRKLSKLRLDYERATERESTVVQAKIDPAKELLQQFLDSASSHLSVIRVKVKRLRELLQIADLNQVLDATSYSDHDLDFTIVVDEVLKIDPILTAHFNNLNNAIQTIQTEAKAKVAKQSELNSKVTAIKDEIRDTVASINDRVKLVEDILSKPRAAESEMISNLLDAVDEILSCICNQEDIDGLDYVSIFTESLSRVEEHMRNLHRQLEQAVSAADAKEQNLTSFINRWREQQQTLREKVNINQNIAIASAQALGVTPTYDAEIDFNSWLQVLDTARDFVNQMQTMVAALDSDRVLSIFKQITIEEEQKVLQQISSLSEQIHGAQIEADAQAQNLKKYQQRFINEQNWWEVAFASIPRKLRDMLPDPTSIHDPEFIEAVLAHVQSDTWKDEVERQGKMQGPVKRMLVDWSERLQSRQPQDVASLKEVYIENANVIGVTCGQVNRIYSLARNRRDLRPFDAVIIDEVSKATPPELLLPMLKGKKIILVGDHKQLPPMVESQTLVDIAEDQGIQQDELSHIKRSLFESLYNFAPRVLKGMLTEQYRMRQPIMNAINQFYDDMLSGGHDRNHALPLPYLERDTSIMWVNTPREEDYFEEKEGFTYRNPSEIQIIAKLLEDMNHQWMSQYDPDRPETRKEVGLITFYMAQLAEFRDKFLHSKDYPALNLRIGTVDRFQGMERQVVIVSLVRNNAKGIIGFAKAPERINVAFSRAQELLVIVGCKSLFARQAKRSGDATEMYSKVAYVVEHEGRMINVSEFNQY